MIVNSSELPAQSTNKKTIFETVIGIFRRKNEY